MILTNTKPITYQQHQFHIELRELLQKLFLKPIPNRIIDVITQFLIHHPLPITDFPRLEGTYSRTILHRHSNGYEAMAARWSKGAVSSIHGHPPFVFYYVIEGKLKIDNFRQTSDGLQRSDSLLLNNGQGFHAFGEPGRFNNSIHQVYADEETLSFHISSDDALKGQVFSSLEERNR